MPTAISVEDFQAKVSQMSEEELVALFTKTKKKEIKNTLKAKSKPVSEKAAENARIARENKARERAAVVAAIRELGLYQELVAECKAQAQEELDSVAFS